jgi:SagB-type dehydrogenase family enzyme
MTKRQALGLAPAKDSLSTVFHENTKLGPLSTRAYAAWILNFAKSHAAQQTLQEAFKLYTLMEHVELPRVEACTELEHVISARRSVRTFSGAPVGVEALARLLAFTYGRTGPRQQFRTVASAGALYPLELYLAAFAVDGLPPGLYHFAAETGHLDVVTSGECQAAFKNVVAWQGIDIDRAALAVVITAAFRRNSVKYLDRGYRMVLVEAGEAAQNLCLLATSMGLGTCLLGGFNDDLLSEMLGIDGVNEAPLVPIVVGRPALSGEPAR